MKYRKWMIVTLLWVVLALVACTATPVPETPHPTATATMVVPTETPIPTETPKPTETPAPQIEYAWECWDGGPVSCPSEPILPANEMTFVSENDGWAVGDKGYIARWDGERWTQMESPTSETLNAVTFLAPDTGWAAGEGGQILRWNGATWSMVREFEPALKGSGNYLIWNAIAFSGPDEGWVVGDISSEGGFAAYVMYWNGIKWENPPVPPYTIHTTPRFLWDVVAFSPQDTWIVGEGWNGGLTLHWDGTEWNPTANPFDSADLGRYWLYDISALAPDNLWVAGTKLEGSGGTDKTVVLRWNGEAWIDMQLSRAGWANAILMLSDDDGWVGGDELFHWNGQEWEKAAKPTAEWDRIVDIQASPDGEVWAITQLGAFLHLETLAEVVTKSLTTSSLESGAHYPVWLGAAKTKGDAQ